MDFPRTHWMTAQYPVTGPAKKAATTQAVAHYSGSDRIPADKVAWLRAMQADYVRNRGYSLGYWWLVCQNGDSYQIRGPELNSAANNGDKVPGNANDWTAPILFDVRTDERLTPAAIATARRLWNSVGVFSRPVPHHVLDATACCGATVTAQIDAGELDNPSPPPPPPPTTEEVDMISLDYKPNTPQWVACTWTGTHLSHVVNGHADGVTRRMGVARAVVSDAEIDGIIGSSVTTTPCPPEWVNTPRGAAWTARRA